LLQQVEDEVGKTKVAEVERIREKRRIIKVRRESKRRRKREN